MTAWQVAWPSTALAFCAAVMACDSDTAGSEPAGASGFGSSSVEPGTRPPGPAPAPSSTLVAAAVEATVRSVADWSLTHSFPNDPRHWSMAPLYDGLIEASLTTGDPRYLAAVIRAGRRVDFILGSRTYHADGHGAGHAWLNIYLMDPEREPGVLQPFIEQFDEIVEHPIIEPLTFLEDPPPGLRRTDRWTWADALYMSPPTIALLAKATGDKRYTRFMDAEVRFTYDSLYDVEDHLWYRDETYLGDRTANGKKVFWSRGNAWVYSGVTHVLTDVPANYPTRCFYTDIFRQMSESLLAAQQPDGLWYTNLADPEQVPIGETSGSSFFVFGMAWGVRLGLLDSGTYWPAVERGWNAILTRIEPDGAVTFVQPFGEAPGKFDKDQKVPFGTGAVLLAGTEILRAAHASADQSLKPSDLLEQASELVNEAPDLSSVCEDCEEP
jgi:unsaturated rhamnogalacturonyl hydrolase